MTDISIHSEYITLQQLLKKLDFISTGGEVKPFLAENEVKVNDEPEDRRGRKLYPGDIVNVQGQSFRLKAE